MSQFQVQLRQQPAMPIAVVRRTVKRADLSRVVPECCGIVWNTLRTLQVKAGRNVAVYWDAGIRLEAGVELLGPFAAQGEVVRSNTPSGSVASVPHFGPYDRLGSAHAAVREWCKVNNHRVAGPNWETYGHWQDAWNNDPSQIRTDVCYQIGDG